MDWLTIAFRGALREDVRALLSSRRAEARELRTSVAVEIGPGAMFALLPTRRAGDGWWLLANQELRVVIEDDAVENWRVEVTASALLLGRVGGINALQCAQVIGSLLLCCIEAERVRRVDLCADFDGFDLDGIDARAWLPPRRSGVAEMASMQQYRSGRNACRTGFTIGKSGVRLRVYDKTEELRLARNEGDKRDEEYGRWRAAGWNGEDHVTRVEFQMRGDALKELQARQPHDLFSRIDAVWAYATRKWTRLVRRGTATRLNRCETDPRWLAVQRVVFSCSDGEIAQRVRERAPARARLVVGVAVNYAASIGAVSPIPVSSGREHVAGWTEERAAAYVREHITRAVLRSGTAAADDLLAVYGARDAAAYVIERTNAACARASRVSETLLERAAIRDE